LDLISFASNAPFLQLSIVTLDLSTPD